MSSVMMMSPGLEDIIDLEGKDGAPVSVGPSIECSLFHPLGAVTGRLITFSEIRDHDRVEGFDVEVMLHASGIIDALRCRAFHKMMLSLDSKEILSKTIQDDWVQKKDVSLMGQDASLVISVRRGDKYSK